MIGPVGRTTFERTVTAVPSASRSETSERRVDPIAAIDAVRIDRRADFLAHLIATRDDHPQTRLRRRADATEAARAYGKAKAALRHYPEGREQAVA
jgi:hypothetical protein